LDANDSAKASFPEYGTDLADSPEAKRKRVKCPECGHEFDA